MKKYFLLIAIVTVTFAMYANDSIPNGSFERWSSTSYDSPLNYPYTSNPSCFASNVPLNVVKTTDACHGLSAVKLTTNSSSNATIGYFLNTPPNQGNSSLWRNGMAYNQKPSGIRGYYKYNVASADSGIILVLFRKAGVQIGNYTLKIGGIKNTYTLFNLPLVPALTQTPDSVVFGAVSSNYYVNQNGVAGSVLFLDSVSFTGVTSQPTLMNGDFEQWQLTQTSFTLDSWVNPTKMTTSINRTTDAKLGTYALELTSILGQKNGNPVNEPGYISTGYWYNPCSCNKGGKPYSNTKDTLAFWYKYVPVSTDNGEVSLEFRKNGFGIAWESRTLTASSIYKYVEVPFNIGQTPDSVIVNLQSSSWANTATTFVGSVLKIDNLMFKSQIHYTGLLSIAEDSRITIKPSVSKGLFAINSSEQSDYSFDIRSITGTKIFASGSSVSEIDLTKSPSGIYFVTFYSNNRVFTRKILKL